MTYPNPNNKNADELQRILVSDFVRRTMTPVPWMVTALTKIAKAKHSGNVEAAFQAVRSEVDQITGRDVVGADIALMRSQSKRSYL